MMARVRPKPAAHADAREGTAALAKLRAQHEELLRNVSHDLRTPLVALVLQAQILERSLEDRDPNRQRAATLVAMTREFTSAIDRLVMTARLEAGLAKYDPEGILLPELVRDLVSRAFPAESRRVVLTAEADLPEVVADRHHVETLVRILLERALAASTADVGLGISRSDGDLHLAVNDQGPPVALTDETTHPARGRLVDSLHLARLIVHLHGGRLWSGSASGQGNTITVALPHRRDRRSARKCGGMERADS
jgi:signal transduction histidine kinase